MVIRIKYLKMSNNCSYTFESNNARSIPDESIANGFILNTQFKEMLSYGHSRILGPRGSGKTTLFKMMSPKVYASCSEHRISEIYPKDLPFWGIIIYTDMQWSSLVDIIMEDSNIEDANKEYAYDILICLSVIASIIECFDNLLMITRKRIEKGNLDYEVYNSSGIDKLEYSLSEELIKILGNEKSGIPTLSHIKRSIDALMRQLGVEIRTNKFSKDSTLISYLDFLSFANSLFEVFENCCRNLNFCKKANFKWALCFDELEVAPEVIKSKIEVSLRGNPHQDKIFIKYSEAPFAKPSNKSGVNARLPMDGHDYNTLYGWVFDDDSRNKWYDFCKRMYSRALNDCADSLDSQFESNYPFRKVISSYYNKVSEDGAEEIKRMAIEVFKNVDTLFKQFHSQNIHLFSDGNQDGDNMVDVELFRYYYICGITEPLYYGLPTICDISEGNPRLAITIMNQVKLNGLPISESIQSKILKEISDDRYYFFSNYPNAVAEVEHPIKHTSKSVTLKDLLDWIGQYMRKRLYSNICFSQKPLVAFTIDKHSIVDQLLYLIDLGLQVGALIKIESKAAGESFYKLAYCLYPHYSLPIIYDVEKVTLSSIIPDDYYIDKNDPINNQLKLQFDEDK